MVGSVSSKWGEGLGVWGLMATLHILKYLNTHCFFFFQSHWVFCRVVSARCRPVTLFFQDARSHWNSSRRKHEKRKSTFLSTKTVLALVNRTVKLKAETSKKKFPGKKNDKRNEKHTFPLFGSVQNISKVWEIAHYLVSTLDSKKEVKEVEC